MNPNEQLTLRYRLFTRAIKVKGVSQMGNLYPYLQTRLDQTVAQQLETQVFAESMWILKQVSTIYQLISSSGWSSIQIAPLMRQCASGLLGVYIFGNALCRLHPLRFETLIARKYSRGSRWQDASHLSIINYKTCAFSLTVPQLMNPSSPGRCLNTIMISWHA